MFLQPFRRLGWFDGVLATVAYGTLLSFASLNIGILFAGGHTISYLRFYHVVRTFYPDRIGEQRGKKFRYCNDSEPLFATRKRG